jgi:hypothetical protein
VRAARGVRSRAAARRSKRHNVGNVRVSTGDEGRQGGCGQCVAVGPVECMHDRARCVCVTVLCDNATRTHTHAHTHTDTCDRSVSVWRAAHKAEAARLASIQPSDPMPFMQVWWRDGDARDHGVVLNTVSYVSSCQRGCRSRLSHSTCPCRDHAKHPVCVLRVHVTRRACDMSSRRHVHGT